jgi:tetratricopeptide (TPR) repeat protein
MVVRLEEVRLLGSSLKQGSFDSEGADRGYATAFRDYGIDVETLALPDAATRIRARTIRVELAAALDGWAQTRRWVPQRERKSWRDLLALARATDPDPGRAALRDAVLRGDRRTLVRWAATAQVRTLPPVTLVLLADHLAEMGGLSEAAALLRRAQPLHPGDFWINHTLAQYLANVPSPQLDEALPYYMAAVALRPDSPGARLNLGNAFARAGRFPAARAAYREAIELKRDYAEAHCNLGKLLWEMGKQDEGVAALRQAIALKPELAEAHGNLGVALVARGRHEEAVAAFRRALALFADRKGIEWKSDLVAGHRNLGLALRRLGKFDEALAVFRKLIELNPDLPDLVQAHSDLGHDLVETGRLAEAVAALRQALELKPDYAEAHDGLGKVFFKMGRFDEAIAAYRRAIALKPELAEAHGNLGVALARKGRHDEELAAYRRAVALKPDLVRAQFNLGLALTERGQLDEALAVLRKVSELAPDFPMAHYDLGRVLWLKGRTAAAVASYRRAIALKPDYAEAHCNLGFCLRLQGQFALALAAVKRGHELGSRRRDWSYPSAQWVRESQRLHKIAGRLPAFLQGKVHPASAAERHEYAELCYCTKFYAAAARARADAFSADPKSADDLQAGHRYSAAGAAALAGCGQGKDAAKLTEKERARWRKQALAWLRADLALRRRQLESGQPKDAEVRQKLRQWQCAPDLAGLRGPEALARLDEVERPAWQQLWQEVDDILARASH